MNMDRARQFHQSFRSAGDLLIASANLPGGMAVRLMQAEFYGDGGLHRHGLVVEVSGLVFPGAQRIERGLPQKRRTRNNGHAGQLAIYVNHCGDGDFAFNAGAFRQERDAGLSPGRRPAKRRTEFPGSRLRRYSN